ncbi:NAD(P)/FAD-dependent oxidoreductase [Lichenicoccus sp.]|uniref:NAD(P)/FAD-dependent oxidoreductase n=1 Tax=Lichenicoccus sp. TaxID=2781899 RepID=UPI003D0E9F2A
MQNEGSVAVIGAGMAGLACANVLHAAGLRVTLFDKGRRPGGRLATRRSGDFAFDHGAQFATARGERFRDFLSAAGDQVAAWDAAEPHPRWVGVPGMSTLAGVAERRGVGTQHLHRQVTFLNRQPDGWHIRHQDAAAIRPGTVAEAGERAGPYGRVVLALPAPQATGLLQVCGHPFASAAGAVVMEPCWAVMLGFAGRQPGADRRTLDEKPAEEQEPDQPFSWIARDSSRPGHAARPDCWVGHAGPGWSRRHLEHEADAVSIGLQSAFARVTGITAQPTYAAVHRWRHARTLAPLGQPCLWDDAGLAVCGDWCLGGKVESAFDSGSAAAGMVLSAG